MDHCPACGYVEEKKKGKPRSVPQHRRFFALVKAAFEHWPETHRFQPINEERMRKWLTAKAGYSIVNTIDTAGMTNDQVVASLAAAIMNADPVHFVSFTGARLHVIQSKSIDFNTLPHLAACALFDAVAETIEAETGLEVSKIMPPISEKRGKVEMRAEVPL